MRGDSSHTHNALTDFNTALVSLFTFNSAAYAEHFEQCAHFYHLIRRFRYERDIFNVIVNYHQLHINHDFLAY